MNDYLDQLAGMLDSAAAKVRGQGQAQGPVNPATGLPPGTGGLALPRPDQQYQGGQGGVIGPGSPNVVRARLVIVSGTGSATGLYVYSGIPALGNLPVFLVVPPGVTADPFGNSISAIVEIGQQSGGHWHWDSSGNLDVNNTASALIATWRPTDQALLMYSPGGGLGKLLLSLAAAAGTDQYGNAYVQGLATYTGGYIFQVGLNTVLGTSGFAITSATSAPYVPPIYTVQQATAAGCSATVFSGRGTISAAGSVLNVNDSLFSGGTGGLIELRSGQVNLGNTGNCIWNDTTQQLTFANAGSGPFVTGESFHTISNAAGLTGTIRIKKVPWNMVYLDVLVSWTATAATTFTCGSLPDSTYYPTVNDPGGNTLLPVESNAAWTTDVQARVFVPTSGAIQVIVGASTAGGNGCFRGFYATN